MDDLPLKARQFELGIWHPLALPADKQNRDGFKMLHGFPDCYPSNVARTQRAQAISAVRAFVNEAKNLIAALAEDDFGFNASGAALHIILLLSVDAGPRIAAEIAQAARRNGLVFYDPQNDILSVPPAKCFGETQNVRSSAETTLNSEDATIITVGPWTVRAFVNTTRAHYKKITDSGSDRCNCDNCSNFVQVRDQAYPPEMLIAFDSLGIDFRKESEVHYYGRTPAGLHTYRGWLYLAGVIETGPEAWYHPPEGNPEKRFHRIGPNFEIGVKGKSDYGFSEWETVLIEAGFSDGPTLEIDFYTDIPWISEAPEPGVAPQHS